MRKDLSSLLSWVIRPEGMPGLNCQVHETALYTRVGLSVSQAEIFTTPQNEKNPNLQTQIYNPMFTTPYLLTPIYQPLIYNSLTTIPILKDSIILG